MSIVIMGIKSPEENCYDGCPCYDGENGYCRAMKDKMSTTYIPKCCPIRSLPEKHGRLIDADAFIDYLENEMQIGLEGDKESVEMLKELIYNLHKVFIGQIQAREAILESEE